MFWLLHTSHVIYSRYCKTSKYFDLDQNLDLKAQSCDLNTDSFALYVQRLLLHELPVSVRFLITW